MGKESQTSVKSTDDHGPADFETAIAKTGYGPYNYLLLLYALVSALSHQSNTQMVSYLLPAAECELELTQFNKGVLNAAPFMGGICSAFLWGSLSDTYGRRRLLVLCYSLDGILNFIAGFSQTFWFLLMIRICNGFFIGGAMSIQKAFLAEYHGFQYRSRVMMFIGFCVAGASMIIPVLAWVVIPLPWSWHFSEGNFTYNSWRLFITVCAMPSFVAAAIIYIFDETPKFLMSNGQHDEALKVMQKMCKWNTGQDFSVHVLQGKEDTDTASSTGGAKLKVKPIDILKESWNQSKPLFMKPYRSKAILVSAIQFWTICGMNSLRLWLPQLFASMEEYNHHQSITNQTGDSVSLCEILDFTAEKNKSTKIGDPCSAAMLEDSVYTNALIVGASMGIVFLVACYFINVIHKKILMVTSFAISGASGIAIYWSRHDTTTLALSSAYVSFLNVCHVTCIALTVELFPTGVRNMAVSLTLMSGQVGSFIGNMVFPVLLELNCVVSFFAIGAVVFGCALLSLPLPKTKFLD